MQITGISNNKRTHLSGHTNTHAYTPTLQRAHNPLRARPTQLESPKCGCQPHSNVDASEIWVKKAHRVVSQHQAMWRTQQALFAYFVATLQVRLWLWQHSAHLVPTVAQKVGLFSAKYA